MTRLGGIAAFALVTHAPVAQTFERDGVIAGVVHFCSVILFIEFIIRVKINV